MLLAKVPTMSEPEASITVYRKTLACCKSRSASTDRPGRVKCPCTLQGCMCSATDRSCARRVRSNVACSRTVAVRVNAGCCHVVYNAPRSDVYIVWVARKDGQVGRHYKPCGGSAPDTTAWFSVLDFDFCPPRCRDHGFVWHCVCH